MPPPPLRRRRLPLPADSRPCNRRRCPCWQQPWPLGPPLAGWPLAVAPYGRRPTSGRHCERRAARGHAHRWLPQLATPCAGGLGHSRPPLCMWPGHGQTPLQGA
ncbi:hypothetical protein BHM03_00058441 [Ensete ventricosum]|nr:hypothetical protein BHM03_00058441 [Ensete ventricosum]